MVERVLGVGLNKTGTTTLGVVMKDLGFQRHQGFRGDLLLEYGHGRMEPILTVARASNNLEDWPWPLVFRQIDKKLVGTKFVLTTRRTPDAWFDSLCRHVERLPRHTRLYREIAYGFADPAGRKKYFCEFYERHNDSVRDHFENRPDDLLEVCWEKEVDLARIAAFVDVEAPSSSPVPIANADRTSVATRRRMRRRRAIRALRNRVGDALS